MRLAFISFEFPPAVAIGGIGTYAWEAVRMLVESGCEVEVFSAGKHENELADTLGVKVHRFDVPNRMALREAIAPVFAERHRERPFDVLESPEIGAEGATVAAIHPEVARVVKLHTPTYLVGGAGWEAPSWLEHLRFSLGALRRGRIAVLNRTPYDPDTDNECQWARQADEIAAPSQAVGERLARDWDLDPGRISCFPYPFLPTEELLSLPLSTTAKTVGFLGRLEARKGVAEFARAIPRILQIDPTVRFRFVGPSWPYRKTDMESWIRAYCRNYLHAIEFVGPVAREFLADELAKCDIMVFPSRWESFGLVCPESMAAGRAVIGSSSGGMAEVIEPGVSGLLVPPHSPQGIADAVISLLGQPNDVARFGVAGRQRVLDFLSPKRILPLQLASYRRAMERARQRLS